MAYQLVINVSSPSIFSSLKRVLESMDGVTIEKKSKTKRKSATEVILADAELMESIERGEKDIADGKITRVTASDINEILGI